jgi:hypothetical protein
MAEFKPYVAVTEFSVNVNNGESEIRAKYGDLIEFDGLSVRAKDVEGQARSFGKVIREGSWVKPIAPEKVGLLKQRIAAKQRPESPLGNIGPDKNRNLTGGKIVENSDVSSTKIAKQNQTDKELQDLVNQYEVESYPDSHDDVNKRNIQETKVEQNVPDKPIKVIDDDAAIVAQVSESASTDAEGKNTAGVELGDIVEEATAVVSDEERVVKATNYSNKEASDDGQKKLQVDSDGDGVVVAKTSVPAVNKNEVNKDTKVDEDSLQVSKEENVVKATSYEEEGSTDVGSSTKAGVVEKKKTTRKRTVKKATKATKADIDSQDGVVVKKVSKTKDLETSDGITVKTTVGKNEESDSDVTFSSGGDGIEGVEAVVSGSDIPVTDLSGTESSDAAVVTTNDSVELDGDIDISDLLD